MRLGVWIPAYTYEGLSYERVREGVDTFSRKANDYGLDLWTIDHLLHAPGLYGNSWLEPMAVTTWAAAVAPDVWVGTGILVLPLRNPVVLAKEIATIDFLTGGRFQFGIGPGWYPPEFTATGTDVTGRGRRCATEPSWRSSVRLDSRGQGFENLPPPRPAASSDGEKAREIQHKYFREAMGTHRSPEHLETCYLFGSVDEIVARLNDLSGAGCEYVVLGPTHDDPAQLDLINNLIVPQLQ